MTLSFELRNKKLGRLSEKPCKKHYTLITVRRIWIPSV